MIPLLSVTTADVAALADDALRMLVALLARQEARAAGMSSTCVRAGGSQDAPDGGLDVIATFPAALPSGGVLARANVGLQVKKPAMSPTAINDEMRPGGALRPFIRDLIATSGSYVIVSSGSSVTESARRDRVEAMTTAKAAEDPVGQLHVDFLGRDEIAAWVNANPGAVLWVKDKLGSSPTGWKPWGRWSRSPNADEAFFVDDNMKLLVEGGAEFEESPLLAGLSRMRERLRGGNRVVRLVGLSGTGKTRVAEALFDDAVGDDALSADDVLYVDVGADPSPSPLSLIEQLWATGSDTVLVVDNCPPALHNRLSQAALGQGSRVRLLTIEYDVREDQPDETDVFRLIGLSSGVLEQLLASRYPHLSDVDRQRLAEVSDGNARIAIGIAEALGRDVDVSSLTNDDLFSRLFHQRHQPDPVLEAAARILSLVYSFDGETVGDGSELQALAGLGNHTADDLFSHAADLVDRDIVQKRSRWRALLPHPLANHLAKRMIDRTPADRLVAFLAAAPERLGTSFCRRIGYLHDHNKSAGLAARIIAEMTDDSAVNRERLGYLAPAAPDAALARIETIVANGEGETFAFHGNLTPLLHALAYDAERFDKCTPVMLEWSRKTRGAGPFRDGSRFGGLFSLHLSGTQAPGPMRIAVAEGLGASADPDDQAAAIEALREMLHSGQWSSSHTFTFGMRRRDFGWAPATYGDSAAWYRDAIDLACRLVHRGGELGLKAKALLAQELPDLLAVPFVGPHALAAVRALFTDGYWPDGWRALRFVAHERAAGLPDDVLGDVRALLAERSPSTLEERLDVIAGPEEWSGRGLDDLDDEDEDDAAPAGAGVMRRYSRANQAAVDLGRELASDPETFSQVLPRLAAGEFGRAGHVAAGLVSAAQQPAEMWALLLAAFRSAPSDKADERMLRGAVRALAERDASLSNIVLDALAGESDLAGLVPSLQREAGFDAAGAARLTRLAADEAVPGWRFRALVGLTANADVSAEQVADLGRTIGRRADGHVTAVDFIHLAIRFGGDVPAAALIEAGAELLQAGEFGKNPGNDVIRHRADLAKQVLRRDGHVGLAGRLLAQLIRAVAEGRAYGWQWRKYVKAILRARPAESLDILLLDGDDAVAVDEIFRGGFERGEDPLRDVAFDQCAPWIDADPDVRHPLIARFAPLLALPANDAGDDAELPKLHPFVRALLDQAQDRLAILEAMLANVDPRGGWSGSLSQILRRRRNGIAELASHPDPIVRDWTAGAVRKLDERIAGILAWEQQNDRREQRFE